MGKDVKKPVVKPVKKPVIKPVILKPPTKLELKAKSLLFMDNLDKDYFSKPDFSASVIKSYENNPDLYEHEKTSKRKQTPALLMGTVIHKLFLENEDFNKHRELYLNALTPLQVGILGKIEENFLKNQNIRKIIKNAKHIEKAIFFNVRLSDQRIKCKAKVDLFSSNTLIDVKSCLNLDKIRNDIDNFRYDIQLAFYKKAVESIGETVDNVMILGVEKSAPYGIQLFRLSQNYLDRGKKGGSIYSKSVRGYEEPLLELATNKLKKRFTAEVMELEVYE